MKRRDVLKAGALTGIAGAMASGTGCSNLLHRVATTRATPDMDAYLAKLDRGMQATHGAGFVERFLPVDPTGFTEAQKQRWAADEDLLRQSVRSLYLAGSFLDLPEEGRMHPGMQERMLDHAPEIGGTIDTLTRRLQNLSETQREKLRQGLHQRPDLPMDIAAGLDRMAASTTVTRTGRTRVRMTMANAGWRLTRQNPSLMIDEYVAKVERLHAQPIEQAELMRRYRAMVDRGIVTGPAIQPQHGGVMAAASQPTYQPTYQSTSTNAQPVGVGSAQPKLCGSCTIRRGLVTMGIGVLFILGGFVFLLIGEEVALLSCGVGVVLLAVGFIILIVGLLIDDE